MTTPEQAKKWREANPGYAKRWREANVEKISITRKRWREMNSEKVKARNKEWREANPEKARECTKRWRERHPEKHAEAQKRFRDKHPERIKEIKAKFHKAHPKYNLKYWLYNQYGLTLSQYQEILDSQRGVCAVCKKDMAFPEIDHCHKTGKVRGLLCCHCNRGLGGFKDSIDFLKEAVYYLSK